MTINWDTMTSMRVNFTLQTLTYTRLGPLLGPDCFLFKTKIVFDNGDFDGQIPVQLHSHPMRKPCPDSLRARNPAGRSYYLITGLNYSVMVMCILSLILCLRALIRARRLRCEAEIFFRRKFGWELTYGEKFEFLNIWYIVICINDISIIAGCVLKQMIESRKSYGNLWDYTAIFLGTGDLLVWIGMLR